MDKTRDDLRSLDDATLSGVLDGLLDVHLRLAFDWAAVGRGMTEVATVTFPRHDPTRGQIVEPLTAEEVLALELATAKHG
jgi:hypothetical protein